MANAEQPFLIPVSHYEHETIVNRSRFICSISHCPSKTSVKEFIENIRIEFPDASHHCYAFVASRPDDSQAYGFSDDGEPSGTAGRPMLAVLQGAVIGEVCAVVTRYFGGIKLGTGGLQRAYGNSVRQAIVDMPTQLKVPTEQLRLICDYQQINDIEYHLLTLSGVIISQDYGIDVRVCVQLPMINVEVFCQRIIEITAGRVTPHRCNQ